MQALSMRDDIFDPPASWRGPLMVSTTLHVGLIALGVALAWFAGRTDNTWGTNGPLNEEHTVSAHMVESAIPLPARENDPNSVLATDSAGQSPLVKPKPAPPEKDAVPIFDKRKPAKPDKTEHILTHQKPLNVPDAPKDVVPFGRAPAAAAPYTAFRAAAGNGGMTFEKSGSFAERYAWYVAGVQRKISENWMKYEVDPGIQAAPRVYLSFDITRDGTPTNVQLSQSSGIPSLDVSAVRALKRIDTFGSLPGDYAGSKVSVEFWFEYKK